MNKIIALLAAAVIVPMGIVCSNLFADNNVKEADESVLYKEGDGVFTIAVIPDTQHEVTVEAMIEKKSLLHRNQWITDNLKNHNIKAVVHTGDLVNWGDAERSQFECASVQFDVLEDLNIPVAFALGNHDTAAVGVGGSAADPQNTRTRVRDTSAFNKYFPFDRFKGFVPYEEDKIDNGYFKFEAEGKKWMIVTFELWPRKEVIDWADNEIKNAHDHNVIIVTHSYLEGDGSIKWNSDYGEKSPLYLYNYLVSKYENIKIVLSGHTGTSYIREDTGVNGNKIVSILGGFHEMWDNPMRLLRIDVNKGTVEGPIYSSLNDSYSDHYTVYASGLEFVDPS